MSAFRVILDSSRQRDALSPTDMLAGTCLSDNSLVQERDDTPSSVLAKMDPQKQQKKSVKKEKKKKKQGKKNRKRGRSPKTVTHQWLQMKWTHHLLDPKTIKTSRAHLSKSLRSHTLTRESCVQFWIGPMRMPLYDICVLNSTVGI